MILKLCNLKYVFFPLLLNKETMMYLIYRSSVSSIEMLSYLYLMLILNVAGLEANVTVQKSQTIVTAGLKDITIYDPSKNTLYKKVINVYSVTYLTSIKLLHNIIDFHWIIT